MHFVWHYFGLQSNKIILSSPNVVSANLLLPISNSGLLRKPKPGLQVSKSYNMPTQELLVLVKDQI